MKEQRVARVIQAMKERNMSQLLVTAPASIFYLTGKWIEPGERMLALYIRDNGDSTLYANRLFALSGNVDANLVEFDDTDDCVAVLAEGVQPGVIGIDKVWPSQFTIRLMEARSDLKPVVGSQAVDDTRICKDAEEIRIMKESSLKNDETIEAVIARLYRGMTEVEGSKMYEEESVKRGSSRVSFDPLICFGANCAEPHHSSDRTVMQEGDAVILDVGLVWNDYCSDMTRTVFAGNPSDEQKRVYDLVRKANEAGRAAVHPGVLMKDIDWAARKVIEDAGFGKYFIHRTGHGIGLEEHEYPDVSATSEVVCKPGMCFSVEPGIYLPCKFGVRVEDLVVVTEDGCETINHVPRDLRVI